MTTSVVEVYRKFLSYGMSLDDLREWLAVNQWNLPEEEQGLIDEADVAIVHFDDGHSSELELRSRLACALENFTTKLDFVHSGCITNSI